jgi:hypothetical protein
MPSIELTHAIMAVLPRRLGCALRERDRCRALDYVPTLLERGGIVIAQHVREGRFQRSLAAVTAGSAVLGGAEVAYEHYRGSYGQRVMWSPVALTPPLVAAAAWCTFDRRAARLALPLASALVLGDGALGFYFHVRGIARKPGGWRIPIFNIIMGPPIFAPLLFALPGYLGLMATFLRREGDARWIPRHLRCPSVLRGLLPAKISRRGITLAHELREGRFQRHLAVVTAASALFSGVEALYSHYKNNFRVWAQWTPVAVAPLLVAAAIGAVWSRPIARTALPVVSLVALANGVAGVGYHARGIVRRPGGLSTPLYNVMYGPPIFAPMLFSAAGFLGLLTSLLRRER